MKSTLKSILLIAAAAMAFSACNEEPLETPKTSEGTNGTHKVTFIASQVETKTTMGINDGVASFAWEEADVNCFHIFENDYSYKAKDAEGKIGNDGLMQITATFENGGSAPFSYFGFFAPTFYTYPQVPAEQTDNGKYDSMADILVAKPVTADASQSGKAVSFQFKRIVAINIMTLKGLTAGETVKDVTIVSDKPIAGKYDYTKDEWYNSTDMEITVSANSVVNDKGEAVIYFVSAPVEDAQLTITATTAAGKTYSKELAKTITFAEGGVKAFGVTVEEDVPVSYGYVKVTSAPTDWSGKYLIVDEEKSYCWTGIDAVNCYATANIVSGVISEVPSGAVTVTISSVDGGYSILVNGGDKNGNYISGQSGSNTIVFGAIPKANELSIAEGKVTILSNNTSFRFNATSGQDRFRYFKTATTGAVYHVPALYRYQEIVPVEEVHVTSVSIDETLSLEVGDTHTLVENVLPENATNKSVIWSSDKESVAIVENGVVTAKAAGTAKITVTTVDGEFTATCDVTVNAAPVKVYSSLADLIADGEPTTEGKPVTVTLTNEVIERIAISKAGIRNGVFIKVSNKEIEIFCNGVDEEWDAFGTLSGILENCTWKKYYDTWELCPADWDELDYTAPVKYDVVVPTGLVGGTVSADIYEAAAGATVTLTATPSTGYQFVSWSVKDASENDVTVTNNAFTMPASDVTVSATFEQSEGGQGGPKTISWSRSETTDTVSENYTLSQNLKSASGYYQDNSTSQTYYLEVKGTTPIFSSTPSSVTFTAKLGGGTTKDLSGNGIMYVVLVDNNGNEITGTKTEVTNKITATTGSDFTVSINVTGVSSAYGFKLYHEKIASYNVRYYSATLTAQ